MNFQQLRILRETVRRNFNLTDVANNLFTSQSGVSKHIKDLEEELGVDIYIRKGKRLLGLTEPGRELARSAERILEEAANMRTLADQYVRQNVGELSIATTHTQARYSLPAILSKFRELYPGVRLKLHQSGPAEIAQLLRSGEVDVAIATEALDQAADFAAFPFYSWHHVVIVPKGHPLTEVDSPDLSEIGKYPIITYHEGFTGRSKVEKAFSHAGITPDIVMSALDADVIKSYVELGLGIGIIAPMAFDMDRDEGLEVINVHRLFAENQTSIALKRGRLLRQYVYQFIQLCSSDLDADYLQRVVET
ncbi:CysB family HTH-type transcriptional regulator [Marinobacterium lutimaris]|uniref:LysR family transcriptional regulator, cys regulon transcriptional activator n=1 Tax=Marinobacterium lutimaris TaxID=568106 RepID=A0A1H5WDW1_9GAMM|nr:CysB family HTH-type transcriptional regulator [Marinobacterium lutimaris]SEF97371.1 LysR family transcriptional regulator, cys regulon transcriptional activator [Marinobacterium lutimaris]